MPRFLLAMLLLPGMLRAEPPDTAVVAIASVCVSEVWDAEHFRPAREQLESATGRFRTRIIHITGYAPSEIERVTFIFHRHSDHAGEMIAPVAVIVPRKPLPIGELGTRAGRSVKWKAGEWAELPGFTLLEGEPLMAATGQAVVLVPFPIPDDPAGKAALAELIRRAVERDAERGALLVKDRLAASAVISGPEAFRYLSGGADEDGVPRELPSELKPLEGARLAAFELAIDKSMKITGEVRLGPANDPARSATALELVLKRLVRLLGEPGPEESAQDLRNAARSLLSTASVTRTANAIRISSSLPVQAKLALSLGSALIDLEAETAKAISKRNLSSLVMGAYSNLNVEGTPLLANICDEQGKPLLSWRVRLLKNLGQEELYNQFKLDEPWDSEHNKKLIAKMPRVFALPSAKPAKEGFTYYQSFSGKKGAMIRPVLREGDENGLNIQEIGDGIGLTLLIVEAGEPVEWTKPADLPFDPDGKLPKLGGHFPGGFTVVFADANVRILKDDIDEKKLKALITANGGEEVTLDE